jgi:hypothetical protein
MLAKERYSNIAQSMGRNQGKFSDSEGSLECWKKRSPTGLHRRVKPHFVIGVNHIGYPIFSNIILVYGRAMILCYSANLWEKLGLEVRCEPRGELFEENY